MKVITCLALFVTLSCNVIAQNSKPPFSDLNKVDCEEANCDFVEVIKDSVNHFPGETRRTEEEISTPEIAYNVLLATYPDMWGEITCWTEYSGHYVFSMYIKDKAETDCTFKAMFYIPKNGTEFCYHWSEE